MAHPVPVFKKVGSEGGSSESGGSESGGSDRFLGGGGSFEYSGWVYHLGVNSIGHEYCHLRYLRIRGKYVEMYKRDPNENPGIKPLRRGVIGHTLMVEDLGRRKVNHGIACPTAGEAKKWMEAFDHAKQQADYELSRGASARNKLNMETEYGCIHSLIGKKKLHLDLKSRDFGLVGRKDSKESLLAGPEKLLRQSSSLGANSRSELYADGGDAIEAHEWKCVRTINGVRIFEDVAEAKSAKGVLVKAVGVVEASADTVFEVVLSLDRRQRYEYVIFTLQGDLELVDSLDGHYDVVYGAFDPRHLTWWQSKRDFVFSRQWFHGQDGTYTILQFPAVHKNRPPKNGYRRTKIYPSTWEIRNLHTQSGSARCLVAQTLEIHCKSWFKWKKNNFLEFEKTIPFGLLSQVSGLKEYIGATPALTFEASTVIVHSKTSDVSMPNGECEGEEGADQFYDAITDKKVKLKNVSWAIASLALRRDSVLDIGKELNPNVSPLMLNPSDFHGTMQQGKDEKDTNCWTSPGGSGFMIRGKTYLKDNTKVKGGDPLLKLIAVDWYTLENSITKLALHPRCLVQSEAGKKLPFILVINLMGYWMVKRAVGTKACLLGKAVTCKYLRQDNFLEIDVDIGSSSVARSIIGLVLGYVTSLVVDLAILIEAKEEAELPEYILGTVRLNRVRLDSAVPLDV
nr:protein ENHANCED DISEASE RESISTANCE 2-like isoform X2 [Ipomoea trifida]